MNVAEKKTETRTAASFDVEARKDELVRQGVPEVDAAEQAEYERRTYEDNQNRQA